MKVITDTETSPMAWTKEMTGWWSVEEDANCFLFVQNRSQWEPTERQQKKWPFGSQRVLFIKKTGILRTSFEPDEFATRDFYAVKGGATVEYWTRNPYKASLVNVNLQERVLARLQSALQAELSQRSVKDLSLQISAIIEQVTRALKLAKELLGIEIILINLAAYTIYQKVEEEIRINIQKLVDRRNQINFELEQQRLQLEFDADRIRVLGSAETAVANERLKGQLQLLANEQNELMRLTGFLSQNPQIADAVAKLLTAYSETRDTQERLTLLQNWLASQGAPVIVSPSRAPQIPESGAKSVPIEARSYGPGRTQGQLPPDSQSLELTHALETEFPGAIVVIEPGSQGSRTYFVERNGVGIRFIINEDKIYDLKRADGRRLSVSTGAQAGPLVDRVRTLVRDAFYQLGV